MTAMWAGGGLYNSWAEFLDRWGTGDRTVDASALPSLQREDFLGDSWERLANRITDALGKRLRLWAETLGRATGAARDEFTVSRALADAHAGLRPIRALAAHPGLPPDLAAKLLEAVDRQIRAAQESLEDQVESMRRTGSDRRAVEDRLRTIRDHPLTSLLNEAAPAQSAPGPAWSIDPTTPPRRRIVPS
jgi:hypothetical protein